jgi:hypothetical protein
MEEVAGSNEQRGTKERAGAGWSPEKGRSDRWPSQDWQCCNRRFLRPLRVRLTHRPDDGGSKDL